MINLECLVYSVGYVDDGICLLVCIGIYWILLDCGIINILLLINEIK